MLRATEISFARDIMESLYGKLIKWVLVLETAESMSL